jgi:hypothetical protein
MSGGLTTYIHCQAPCRIPLLTRNRKAKAADVWFEQLEKLTRLLRKKKLTREYEHVKIAILDTGIRESSPYWGKIKGYEDFVTKGNKLGTDKTGHGTTGVHLIFKVLPEADIYVARVFDHEQADDDTPSLMAEVCNYNATVVMTQLITSVGDSVGKGSLAS